MASNRGRCLSHVQTEDGIDAGVFERLNALLRDGGCDVWLETLCKDSDAEGGRPSIPPGVYFRMLFVGDFEDLTSRRGIAWRCHDSLSLRTFLRIALTCLR